MQKNPISWVLGVGILATFLVAAAYMVSRDQCGKERQKQLDALLDIERDAMDYGTTSVRVVERIRSDASAQVQFGNASPSERDMTGRKRGKLEVCVLSPIRDFTGFGGLWVVTIESGPDGWVTGMWYEYQPRYSL